MAASESEGAILSDLRELLQGKGIKSHPPDVQCDAEVGFIPETRKNVCYITGALLFNDKGEVLMIQEAKTSCRGTWYLPMGRLERGETLLEGAQREVLEESGLQFTPTSLLSVEYGGGSWYRFTYTGTVTGGKLKTVEEKDEESLQALWIKYEEIMDRTKRTIRIRAPDIFKLIELGYRLHTAEVTEHIPPCLGSCTPHQQLIFRLVLLQRHPEKGIQLLVNTSGGDHFPTTVISVKDRILDFVMFRLLKDVCGKQLPNPLGVLSVEYCGKPVKKNDGICLTVIGEHTQKPGDEELTQGKGFHWITVPEGDTLQALSHRLQKKLFIPFLSI